MGKKKSRSDATRQTDHPMGRPKKWLKPAIIGGIAVAGLAVGLAITLGISRFGDISGDKQLKQTANSGGFGKFPGYVTNTPVPGSPQAYQAVVDFTEEMEKIPCFCGCSQHGGHQSVRYCFIEKDDPTDENILFDRHGASCKMCIDIANETADGLKKGDSLKDIRTRIEEKQAKNRQYMTPTPPIED